MEETKLEYIDWKNAADNIRREIKSMTLIIGINQVMLKAAEAELKKYKPPKMPKEKEEKEKPKYVG